MWRGGRPAAAMKRNRKTLRSSHSITASFTWVLVRINAMLCWYEGGRVGSCIPNKQGEGHLCMMILEFSLFGATQIENPFEKVMRLGWLLKREIFKTDGLAWNRRKSQLSNQVVCRILCCSVIDNVGYLVWSFLVTKIVWSLFILFYFIF